MSAFDDALSHYKLAADPRLRDVIFNSLKRLGSAGENAVNSASQAYGTRVNALRNADISRFDRSMYGAKNAIPAAVRGFHQAGGTSAALPLIGVGLAGYGAKKLVDQAIQPKQNEQEYGMFRG